MKIAFAKMTASKRSTVQPFNQTDKHMTSGTLDGDTAKL